MPYRKGPLIADAYYHVYNRGVEKRIIFKDEEDYATFYEILRYYLLPDARPVLAERTGLARPVLSRRGFLKDSLQLLCYCLMPNHFHLLVKQLESNGLVLLFRALGTAYAMYFNQKYQRVGSLFQGRFKAKRIETEEYLLQLSAYIHRNPLELLPAALSDYRWSSYPGYLGVKEDRLCDKTLILSYFSTKQPNPSHTYSSFVEADFPGLEREDSKLLYLE